MKTILQIASIAVLAGHGWEHMLRGGPYRAFFLNDNLMRGFAERLGYQWIDVLQNPAVDSAIMQGGRGVGVFFLIAALVACFARQLPKWMNGIFLLGGSFLLCFYAFVLFLEKAYQWGLWLEYAAQFTTPVFLFAALYWSVSKPKLIIALKIVIAITFICHGLYAIGFYPRPGHFVDMMIYGFGISETVAHQILFMVGIIDIVVAILLFLPYQWVVYMALIYTLIWGFLTSIARIVTTFEQDVMLASLQQHLPEVLYRFPHFLLPLLAIVLIYQWDRRHRAIGL